MKRGIAPIAAAMFLLSPAVASESERRAELLKDPNVAVYLAAPATAVNMFDNRLSNRLSANNLSSFDVTANLFWGGLEAKRLSFEAADRHFKSEANTFSVEFGGDIGIWKVNDGNLHAGLLASYGESKIKGRAFSNGLRSEMKVQGVSGGAYVSWFQEDDARYGLYLDGVTRLGNYRNKLTALRSGDSSYKYNTVVWNTSFEAGYGFVASESENYDWIITPQAEVTYNYYDDREFRDNNGLYHKSAKGTGVDARLGVRFQGVSLDSGLDPYIDLAYLYSSAKYKADFDSTDPVSVEENRPKNRFEIMVGVNGYINENLTIGAKIGAEFGKDKFKQYKGQMDVNYRW